MDTRIREYDNIDTRVREYDGELKLSEILDTRKRKHDGYVNCFYESDRL